MYGDDPQVARNFEAALAQGSSGLGGFLVPEQQSRDLIEYLRNVSVVRAAVRSLPFKGTMTIPSIEQGTTAQYLGELVDDLAQDLTFGQRRLTEHKLRALVAISNDLIRNSSPEADMIVRDDLANALGEAENAAFLRGNGLGANPKGLRYWAESANVRDGTGSTAAAIEADLIAMASRFVLGMKGRQSAPRWIMPSRSYYTLFGLRHLVGSDPTNLIFPEIRNAEPRVLGWPVDVTDAIPTNLAPGTVGEIYLYDSATIILGDSMTVAIAMSDTAAYKDAAGTMQSAFSLDASVLRAISIHDLVARHPGGIHVLTGSNVVW